MKKANEMRAEYRSEDLGKGISPQGRNNQRALRRMMIFWCNALRLLTPYSYS